jgi:hypothetical protein
MLYRLYNYQRASRIDNKAKLITGLLVKSHKTHSSHKMHEELLMLNYVYMFRLKYIQTE